MPVKSTRLWQIAMLSVTTCLAGSMAHADDMLKKALIDDATPYLNMRYRYEHVDSASFTKDAKASTLRTKLGYKTGSLYNFSGVVEFENVTEVGPDDYNNTINGKTTYPTVADPASTEVNQAYLAYAGIPDTTVSIGRHIVNLDNQRFIGSVGWRQNDQTMDMVLLSNKSLPDTTLTYGYVNNVNRIFSDDSTVGNIDTNTHVFNASYAGIPFGTLTGYAYLLDMEDSFAYSLSSNTYGLRFAGGAEISEGLKLLYSAEYASQSDTGKNTTNYDADYYNLEGGLSYAGLTALVGYEELGSDNGTAAFQTPLATLHKFNGWADIFLTTPTNGLEDTYASLTYKVKGVDPSVDGTSFKLVYHDFSADNGGADYGDEWDAQVAYPFLDHYSVSLKYADYDADSFSADTEKFWFIVGAKF